MNATQPAGVERGMSRVRRGFRGLVPSLVVPLTLVASVLGAVPWLRSFPSSLAAVPMYGAAVLSVLIPLVVVRYRPAWLWLGVLVDAVAFVAYTLLVVLEHPGGFGDLAHGLFQGPSQILTYALPLVSPRSLMVAPVALIWLAGAIAGECVARHWYTLLPYLCFLISFGLAYAATQRASASPLTATPSRETALAGALLVTLLLMRAGQAWVRQDETAESTQPDGLLPLRGFVVGTVLAVVIAVLAAFAVQSSVFPKRAHAPQRVPSIDQSRPLTPLSFVAGLRPNSPKSPGQPVFTVTTDNTTPGYFALANVDYYDGAGWSFTRTFRPSGGVLPADTDPALRPKGELTQQYRIDAGPLTRAPWMPFVYRAQRVTGQAVDIDPASGMIVPLGTLGAGTTYTVRSGTTPATFDHVRAGISSPDTATSTIDTQLPGTLRATLDEVIHALSQETHTPPTPALPFLQALQRDLRTNYTLSDAARGVASGTVPPAPSPAPSTSGTSTHRPRDRSHNPLPNRSPRRGAKSTHRSAPRSSARPSAKQTPTPTPTGSASPGTGYAGATGFADVLASILGPSRHGTPEQFATLLALIARDLGVPARVVTGFRVEPPAGAGVLAPGRYDVTTADAWTWAEIPLNGVGWVVLDGSPARLSNDTKPTESGAPPPPSSSAPPSQNALITAGDKGNAVAPKSAIPHLNTTATHALLIALLVVIGVLIVVLLVVLLTRKRVRAARRRRSPDPRLRVIGAWQENLDMLAEVGLPDLTALTSTEIAALTGEQFGADAAGETASLGAAANAAAYRPSGVVAVAEAETAWQHHRSVRRQIHRQLGVRGRVAAGLRYHRHGQVHDPVSPASWDSAERAARGDDARPRHSGRHLGRHSGRRSSEQRRRH